MRSCRPLTHLGEFRNSIFAPLLLLVILLPLSSAGQSQSFKFGKFSKAEVSMGVCPIDSSADAVVLMDVGKSYHTFNQVGRYNVERHVRIKILRKSGFNWANVAIPLWQIGSGDYISDLEASTFTPGPGGLVETKIDKSTLIKAVESRFLSTRRFAFPKVEVGSILEYKYTVTSPLLGSIRDWRFQWEIPVLYSEYTATIPEFFKIQVYMQGYVESINYNTDVSSTPRYSENIHHWVATNVPAFKTEPYVSTKDNYLSQVNFAIQSIKFPPSMGVSIKLEVNSSWAVINEILLDDNQFGGVVHDTKPFADEARQAIGGETDPLKKAILIYDHVRSKYEWDQSKLLYSYEQKEFLRRKVGSCADINLLLTAMLNAVDILSEPVILSTRDHGLIFKQYPKLEQMNYVIALARIDGKPFLLDATDKHVAPGVLPERCLNGEGLIISKSFHAWIPLLSKTRDKITINSNLTINAEGTATGSVSIQRDGYAWYKSREQLTREKEPEYLKAVAQRYPAWEVSGAELEEPGSSQANWIENFQVTIPSFAHQSGNVIYLLPFVGEHIQDNPFKSETREYPVDFASLKETVLITKLTIPQGYLIEEIPKNRIVILPEGKGKFMYSATALGNTISVMTNFQLNSTFFSQLEYADLRAFYLQILAKQSEQIVLRKQN